MAEGSTEATTSQQETAATTSSNDSGGNTNAIDNVVEALSQIFDVGSQGKGVEGGGPGESDDKQSSVEGGKEKDQQQPGQILESNALPVGGKTDEKKDGKGSSANSQELSQSDKSSAKTTAQEANTSTPETKNPVEQLADKLKNIFGLQQNQGAGLGGAGKGEEKENPLLKYIEKLKKSALQVDGGGGSGSVSSGSNGTTNAGANDEKDLLGPLKDVASQLARKAQEAFQAGERPAQQQERQPENNSRAEEDRQQQGAQQAAPKASQESNQKEASESGHSSQSSQQEAPKTQEKQKSSELSAEKPITKDDTAKILAAIGEVAKDRCKDIQNPGERLNAFKEIVKDLIAECSKHIPGFEQGMKEIGQQKENDGAKKEIEKAKEEIEKQRQLEEKQKLEAEKQKQEAKSQLPPEVQKALTGVSQSVEKANQQNGAENQNPEYQQNSTNGKEQEGKEEDQQNSR